MILINMNIMTDLLAQDVIISNSEDKTIKVWDLNRRICLDTYKRDTDRYWILAVHPDLHYVAAGSDSGIPCKSQID